VHMYTSIVTECASVHIQTQTIIECIGGNKCQIVGREPRGVKISEVFVASEEIQ